VLRDQYDADSARLLIIPEIEPGSSELKVSQTRSLTMKSTTLTTLFLCAALTPVASFAKPDKDNKHANKDHSSYHRDHKDKKRDDRGYDDDRYDRDYKDRDYKDRDYKDRDYRDRYDAANYFDRDRRRILDRYYQTQYSSNCPPGLAKKNNGCMPPGQYKKWQRNQTLPRNVNYYDLPSSVYRDLGRTYDGQKVVGVGGDVLLIDTATRLILDVLNGPSYR